MYTLLQDKWSDWDRQLASSIEYWHKRFPSCASIQVYDVVSIYIVYHMTHFRLFMSKVPMNLISSFLRLLREPVVDSRKENAGFGISKGLAKSKSV